MRLTEAATAVLRHGFEQMELNRVEATVLTGNTASIALLKRIGFQHEGELRERALHRGRYHDVHIFGLTRSDWAANTRDPLLPLADHQVLLALRESHRTAPASARLPGSRSRNERRVHTSCPHETPGPGRYRLRESRRLLPADDV